MAPMPSLPLQPDLGCEQSAISVSAERLQNLLLDLLEDFEEERASAAKRHNEILSRLPAPQSSQVAAMEDRLKSPEQQDSLQLCQSVTAIVLPPKISGKHAAERSNQTTSSSQSNTLVRVPTSHSLKSLTKIRKAPPKASPSDSSQPGTTTSKAKKRIEFGDRGIIGSVEKDGSPNNLLHSFSNAVRHHNFELAFAVVIMINALVMCFDVQYRGLQVGFAMQYNGFMERADQAWPGAQATFDIFDWIFGLLLSLEVMLRIIGFRCMYMRDVWNYLDLICLLAFLAEKVAATVMPIDRQTIQLFRMFRLLRLIRLIRSLEGADGLYILTTAIRGINFVLAWTVLLLSVLLMTCALVVTQLLHTFYFQRTPVAEIPPEMFEYFGTFTRCMASMFELTLANWPPVARLLCEEVSEWFMLLCLIHKLTIGLAVIGVMNGVILQETFKVAATDDLIMVRQKKRAAAVFQTKMSRLFAALDSDGDGFLDYDEFVVIAGHPEVRHWLASMDIETDDLQTLFACVDVNKTGRVSVEDFLRQIPRIRGPLRTFDLLALRESLKINYNAAAQTFADVGNRIKRQVS